MATMWPHHLPRWVTSDPRRSAEIKVYNKLAEILDAPWVVYYSRPWWGVSQSGGEIDGESDFIVAHPDRGVLFIEVKGGGIEYAPATDSWISTDRHGIRHRIKDPARQAYSSKHNLLRKFASCPGWPPSRVRVRHGVIFPDCETETERRIATYERELFCCASEFANALGSWIDNRLRPHHEAGRANESGPGPEGIKAIDSTIAAPARLSVPLHRKLAEDISQQDELLTGAQLGAIHSIESYPRVVVEGGAGTGKTVIARELAARYAREGLRTLLCCSSNALCEDFKRRIPITANLDILPIPEASSLSTEESKTPYDAVIIDEGQDVSWEQWGQIEPLASAPGGRLRVMYDSNQAVYRSRDDLETRLQAMWFPLRLNLRNTKQISRATEKLYAGPLIACAGPEGTPVQRIETAEPEVPRKIAGIVYDFINEKGISTNEIAVLSRESDSLWKIRKEFERFGIMHTDAIAFCPQHVIIDSIATFKGLESAVIIAHIDRSTGSNMELSYVATSRARALLILIGNILNTKLEN